MKSYPKNHWKKSYFHEFRKSWLLFEVTCALKDMIFVYIHVISLFQSYTNFVFDRIELTAIFVTHDTLIYFSRAHDFEPWFLLSPFFSHCHARFKIPGYYTISHRFYLCMFELAFLYSRLPRLIFSFNSLLEFEFQAILAWSHNCLFVFTHWISLSHPDPIPLSHLQAPQIWTLLFAFGVLRPGRTN